MVTRRLFNYAVGRIIIRRTVPRVIPEPALVGRKRALSNVITSVDESRILRPYVRSRTRLDPSGHVWIRWIGQIRSLLKVATHIKDKGISFYCR